MSEEAVYEFVTRVDSDHEIARALRGAAGVDAIVRIAGERGFVFTPGELAPVLELLRFLDSARGDAWLRGELASARDPEAVVALARGRGYAFSSDELAHLDVAPISQALDDQDLDRVVGGTVRLDATPARVSTNLSIQRQTLKNDFGSMMAAGLSGGTAAGLAAPFIPGAAVVSAAVGGTSGSGGGTTSTGSD